MLPHDPTRNRPPPRRVRRGATLTAILATALLVAGCSSPTSTGWPSPSLASSPVPGTAPTPFGAAPSATAQPAPTPSPSPAPTLAPPPKAALESALRFVDEGSAAVSFTDWSRVLAGESAPSADGAERVAAMKALLDREAPASAFALRQLRTQRETWGWDSFDLAWEATITGSLPPVFILAFSADFDFGPIEARFAQRGFQRVQGRDAVVYAHALDLRLDWLAASELAITNTAVIEREGILLLSSSGEALSHALDLRAAGGDAAPGGRRATALALASALGTPASAALDLDPGFCLSIVPTARPSLPLDEAASLDALVASAGRLARWTGFGLGYARSVSGATARFALTYADPAVASADAAARETLARDGRSLRDGSPLSRRFTLRSVSVADGTIVLDVSPADDRPATLLRLVLARDVLFAACG